MGKSLPPICNVESCECTTPLYVELTPPTSGNYTIKFTPSGRYRVMKFCEGHIYERKIFVCDTKMIKYVGFSEGCGISDCQYRYFSFNDNKIRFHFIGTCGAEAICNTIDCIPKTFTIFSGEGSTVLSDILYSHHNRTEGILVNANIEEISSFFKCNTIIQPSFDIYFKNKMAYDMEVKATQHFIDTLYDITHKKVVLLYTSKLTQPFVSPDIEDTRLFELMLEHNTNTKISWDTMKSMISNNKDKTEILLAYPYFRYLILNKILKFKDLMVDNSHHTQLGHFMLADLIIHGMYGVSRDTYKKLNTFDLKDKIYEINDIFYPIVQKEFANDI